LATADQAGDDFRQVVNYEMVQKTKWVRGSLAQLDISSDWIREEDENHPLAFVRVDGFGESSPIDVIRILTFGPKCSGHPISFIQYSQTSPEVRITPQAFAVSRGTCSEIEVFANQGEETEQTEKFELHVH
jgi:hypothetical protein